MFNEYRKSFNGLLLSQSSSILPGLASGYTNLQLLHRHCHDTKTASDGSLRRAYEKGQIIEEPDEVNI